ncbi:replication-associated recombination protein A [bacterium]|nr:replication-associated recombination protein A [bacterium]
MSLFREAKPDIEEPLAARMRPRNLEEFVGQEHLLGEGRLLRKAIEEDKIGSMIFYGPPGCGKSTLALIIAKLTKAHFEQFSATSSTVADIRKAGEMARKRKAMGQKTILFVDEIHRFNKAQQDAFLPYVEEGSLILIGSTTENPYFTINSPLLSRMKVLTFNPLSDEDLRKILKRALEDERGLKNYNLVIDEAAEEHLIRFAEGDARNLLNSLELAALITPPDEKGIRHIGIREAEEASQKRALLYDREGDEHYQVISAYIKSIRGSDPDAAVYWLARMLYAGEDPRFIARRLVIAAAEDIGNADPLALLVATAAAQAVELIGMPEAQIPLAQATIYLATAPKSNSAYLAISRAMNEVAEGRNPPVPLHLRNPSYWGAKKMGYGKDYKYPHSYEGHFVVQDYLPKELLGKVFYEPTEEGEEKKIKERLEKWRKLIRLARERTSK